MISRWFRNGLVEGDEQPISNMFIQPVAGHKAEGHDEKRR